MGQISNLATPNKSFPQVIAYLLVKAPHWRVY